MVLEDGRELCGTKERPVMTGNGIFLKDYDERFVFHVSYGKIISLSRVLLSEKEDQYLLLSILIAFEIAFFIPIVVFENIRTYLFGDLLNFLKYNSKG